ncbi:MAG: hypothetical protein V3R99_06975 [Thermoguttaceae bacterium]
MIQRRIEDLQPHHEKLKRALEDAQQRQAHLTHNLNEMRSQVDAHDISVEGAIPILQSLEKDKIAAEIQCYATESRIVALRKAIDGLSAKSQTLLEQDKVLQTLKRILAHHQQKVDQLRAMQKQAVVSAVAVGDAETELAEVELRVLLRQEDLRKSDSAEGLAKFNQQLIELTVDQAEYEARRRFITERLREIRPVMKLIEEYRHLERKVSAESVDELREKLAESERLWLLLEREYEETSRQLKELEAADKSGEKPTEKDPEKP